MKRVKMFEGYDCDGKEFSCVCERDGTDYKVEMNYNGYEVQWFDEYQLEACKGYILGLSTACRLLAFDMEDYVDIYSLEEELEGGEE